MQIFSYFIWTVGLTARQRGGRDIIVWSQQETAAITSSPDWLWVLNLFIIRILLFTKSWTVCTTLEMPLGNLALPVVAGASFVYIVWLIACKEHNELLMSCASDPAATVCTVNVIRDSASCPWWAPSAVVFTCAFSIFPNVGQGGTVCGQVRSCLWMISLLSWLTCRTLAHTYLSLIVVYEKCISISSSRQFVYTGKLLIAGKKKSWWPNTFLWLPINFMAAILFLCFVMPFGNKDCKKG